MKVVILAGGLGTRLAEETDTLPKPMVEVGQRPLLWHIMKHLGHYNLNDFTIALGYKGDLIKRYFVDLAQLGGDLSIDMKTGDIESPDGAGPEPWEVHLVDTGIKTNTGGRIRRLREHVGDAPFLLTYGDGVSDVNIDELRKFHMEHGKLITVTAVRPPARFGGLEFESGQPAHFVEKPRMGSGWINGGFMIVDPKVIDFIAHDQISLEYEVFEQLSQQKQIMAFPHEGFWQCVDTLRELRLLRSLWDEDNAPWRTWR